MPRQPPITDVDDSVLLARISAGEEDAFRTAYLTYAPKLVELAAWLTGNPHTGEDLVHDIFAELWTRRTTTHIRDSLRVYLYQAVRNRAANVHRRARTAEQVHQREVEIGKIPGLGSVALSPDQAVIDADIAATIDAVVRDAPPARRQAATLYFRHDLSYEEIARVMDISVAAAKMHVTRVRAALRPILERVLELAVVLAAVGGIR